ncbi:hypothetical protein ACLB2K_063022 [Fragaria x ananassa]
MFEAVDSDEEAIRPEYNSDDGFENTKSSLKADNWLGNSDSDRIQAICKADNCDFELRATRMQHESTLLVRKYIGGHTCARVQENTMVRTPYLVDRFSQFIKLNPDISTENFRGYMAAEVRASVSFQQAYRTKRALEMLEKSMNEQYARVQDYAKELKRVDPNTTVDIKCDFNNPQQLPIFKRRKRGLHKGRQHVQQVSLHREEDHPKLLQIVVKQLQVRLKILHRKLLKLHQELLSGFGTMQRMGENRVMWFQCDISNHVRTSLRSHLSDADDGAPPPKRTLEASSRFIVFEILGGGCCLDLQIVLAGKEKWSGTPLVSAWVEARRRRSRTEENEGTSTI